MWSRRQELHPPASAYKAAALLSELLRQKPTHVRSDFVTIRAHNLAFAHFPLDSLDRPAIGGYSGDVCFFVPQVVELQHERISITAVFAATAPLDTIHKGAHMSRYAHRTLLVTNLVAFVVRYAVYFVLTATGFCHMERMERLELSLSTWKDAVLAANTTLA